MTKTLALVGCGSEKRDEPTEAKSLYTSTYFAKKRQWAEGCHAWRILSAEHGVVHPTTVLEPYDTAMTDLSDTEAADWGTEVIDDLRPQITGFDEVVILAGHDYVTPIHDDLHELVSTVRWPFQGKRLFEQVEWLKHNSPPDQSTIGSFE
ncbi:hypothetical protein HTZ84_21135 [Haloterrigena sp. SYSU A558-1]|uniref:DUF6884 domain-containing protein n=1 Tax=Haloterrigena gelatinilytica TaxID=2741724 RepID=A0ABX2LEU0_9EURY|nr:DUF6884 domain-containing protein [Haloterrigena gelatinilytica]NUC74770.1 hypothetical protein [Haloterrigena gelatinilytica]